MEHSPAALPPMSVGDAPVVTAAYDGAESKLSTLLFDVSQQVQDALQNMLKMTSEIEQSAGEIEGEMERAKEAVAEKSRILEEEKDRFQKAALAALKILDGTDDI